MKAIFVVYMLILGTGIGGVLTLGVFVAPVVFNANLFINEPTMSLLDSGMIMSEVFYRFGIFLNFVALSIISYEGYMIYLKKHSLTPLVFATVSVVCIGLFTLYFTPYVLEAQQHGLEGITSQRFETIHKLAELDFKVLLGALVGLFGYRLVKLST
ncbi:MAG: DUF4149 domain-containing protein [Campylobacterales bacterium]